MGFDMTPVLRWAWGGQIAAIQGFATRRFLSRCNLWLGSNPSKDVASKGCGGPSENPSGGGAATFEMLSQPTDTFEHPLSQPRVSDRFRRLGQ